MHLFLRDRRPRRLTALLVGLAALTVLVIALAGLRLDLAELRAFFESGNEEADPTPTSVQAHTRPSAADSRDVRARIALAWSYADLGRRSEGLGLLARLRETHPQDGEIAYAYATLLAQGSEAGDLEHAFELYDAAAVSAPHLGALARLNQGLLRGRLGDASGGTAIWREQLARQPGEPYRSLLEDVLSRVESGDG